MRKVRQIVLLPGLDGTGRLFEELVGTLPAGLKAVIVAYPTDRFLSYSELQVLVDASLPASEPFVLLGESFSAPLALQIAASKPRNLVGVILSSGFVYRPVGAWTELVKVLARPWIFRVDPPRLIAKYFAIGMDARGPVVEKSIRVWRSVSPAVLSGRVREAMRCDARADLARTTVPTLYLQGTQDHLVAETCVKEVNRIREDLVIAKVAAPHMILQRIPIWGADTISMFIERLQT